MGLIFRNPNSKWACAPVIVPKIGPDGYRFTVDLRPINVQTRKVLWPMPLAKAMLSKLSNAIYSFFWIFCTGTGNSHFTATRRNANPSIPRSEYSLPHGYNMVLQTPWLTFKHQWSSSFHTWSY